jgi:hypothetical protein
VHTGVRWADRRISEAQIVVQNSEFFGETIPIRLSAPRRSEYDSGRSSVRSSTTEDASSSDAEAHHTELRSHVDGDPELDPMLSRLRLQQRHDKDYGSFGGLAYYQPPATNYPNNPHIPPGQSLDEEALHKDDAHVVVLEWFDVMVLFDWCHLIFMTSYDFFWRNIGFTLSIIFYLIFEFVGAASMPMSACCCCCCCTCADRTGTGLQYLWSSRVGATATHCISAL